MPPTAHRSTPGGMAAARRHPPGLRRGRRRPRRALRGEWGMDRAARAGEVDTGRHRTSAGHSRSVHPCPGSGLCANSRRRSSSSDGCTYLLLPKTSSAPIRSHVGTRGGGRRVCQANEKCAAASRAVEGRRPAGSISVVRARNTAADRLSGPLTGAARDGAHGGGCRGRSATTGRRCTAGQGPRP